MSNYSPFNSGVSLKKKHLYQGWTNNKTSYLCSLKMTSSSNKGRNMGSGLTFSCPLPLLFLLLLIMFSQGIGGRNVEEHLKTTHQLMKPVDQRVHVHHPSSHMDHMDPSLMVFFTIKDLKVGKTMPVYFPKRDTSKSPRLLPRSEADSIPFSSEQLPHLLEFFSFSTDSPQAKAMEDTLRDCESEPIRGETKLCPTSFESMLEFTRSMLGPNTPFTVVATTHLTNSTIHFQNYTILEEPKEIFAPKMVSCHTMPYPYAVFYCHIQQSVSKVYMVELGGENGDRVEAVAVCHLDTSDWSPNHASFSVLRIKPGTSPVCHFFPADNLVWVPTSTSV